MDRRQRRFRVTNNFFLYADGGFKTTTSGRSTYTNPATGKSVILSFAGLRPGGSAPIVHAEAGTITFLFSFKRLPAELMYVDHMSPAAVSGANVTLRVIGFLATLAAGMLPAQPPSRALGFGLGGGLTVHSGPPDLSRLGPAASAFVAWRTAPRLALRLETLIATFNKSSDVVYSPCAPEPAPTPCVGSSGPLTVSALIAGIRWDDSTVAAGNTGSYLMLAGGFYRAVDHPTSPGATRLGWTAGFGFLLSRAAPRLALEVRYHQIPRWPGDRLSVIPVALVVGR